MVFIQFESTLDDGLKLFAATVSNCCLRLPGDDTVDNVRFCMRFLLSSPG